MTNLPRAVARAICLALELFLGLSLSSSAALAQTPPANFAFPKELGGFTLASTIDYETKTPGFGIGGKYVNAPQFMEVFYYDQRLADIPDGADSEQAQKELATAKNDVFRAKRLGAWDSVTEKGAFASSEEPTKFQCLQFELEHSQRKGEVDSFLCLKGWRGKFFKIRLTMPKAENSQEKAKSAVLAWEQYLKNQN